MIRVIGVRKRINGREILAGVDLHVVEGEVLAIVGPSGTGKSVLLRHIIGLETPDEGDILIGGRSIARAGYREMADIRAEMGYVFQDSALLDSLTVRENLELAFDPETSRHSPLHAWWRISHTIELVNLDETILDQYPSELSGGMRKRVAVARAILNQPRVLLYDEPTTGLDPHNADVIHELITRTRDVLGSTCVVVTHDHAALPRLADRVALVTHGRVQWIGSPQDFARGAHPSIRQFLSLAPGDDAEEA